MAPLSYESHCLLAAWLTGHGLRARLRPCSLMCACPMCLRTQVPVFEPDHGFAAALDRVDDWALNLVRGSAVRECVGPLHRHRTWYRRSAYGFVSAGALHCLLAAWLPGHRLLVRLRSRSRRGLTSIQLSGSLPSSLGSLKIATLCVVVLSASASSCGTAVVRGIAAHGVSFLQVTYSTVSLASGCPVSTGTCSTNRARAGH